MTSAVTGEKSGGRLHWSPPLQTRKGGPSTVTSQKGKVNISTLTSQNKSEGWDRTISATLGWGTRTSIPTRAPPFLIAG